MAAMSTPLLCLLLIVVGLVLYFVPTDKPQGTKVNQVGLVCAGVALLAFLLGHR